MINASFRPSLSLLFGAFCVMAVGAGAAWGLYYSWHWPLAHDAATLHYIAWRLLGGAVPYRDIYEADLPVTYALHMLCIRLLGESDAAFRAFDLTMACLSAYGFWRLLARDSRGYALAAGAMFLCFHLSHGVKAPAERDFLMVPFILLALSQLHDWLARPSLRSALLCGLWIGVALGIKPVAALLGVLSLPAMAVAARPWKQWLRAGLMMGLGAALPVAAMLAWLAASGGFHALVEIFLEYMLPFYARLQPPGWQYWAIFVLTFLSSFAFVLAGLWHNGALERRDRLVMLVALAYGFAHFIAQGKGMWYHVYPLAAAAILLVAWQLARPGLCRIERLLVAATAAVGIFTYSPLAGMGQAIGTADAELVRWRAMPEVKQQVQQALERVPASLREDYLKARPQQAVAFMGHPSGELWNLAYREHWVTPLRHIYSFPLYGLPNEPFIERQAQQLHRALADILPPVVLVSGESWPYSEPLVYRTLDGRQPWQRFLAGHYRLVQDNPHYRIYYRIR